MNLEGSIVPIYKSVGISSFKVVERIRRVTKVKRVGHGGTLDPFAEGVLVVGIGRSATKQLGDVLNNQEKEYIGRVALGIVTDTYDRTGTVVEEIPFDPPDPDKIEGTLRLFRGDIEQVPPRFSALKVNGMKMYEAARKGIAVEPKPRRVFIRELRLIQMHPNGFDIHVTCSHGTYIRSLAYDIGRALNTGAHLSALTRRRVGHYTADQAISLDEFISKITAARQEEKWKSFMA